MGISAYGHMGLWDYGQKCHFPREKRKVNFHPELGSGPGSGPGSRPWSNKATKATRPQKQQGRKSNKVTKATRPQKQQSHKSNKATKISLVKDFTLFSRGPALDFQGFNVISKGLGLVFSEISRHFQGPRSLDFQRFRVILKGPNLGLSRIPRHFKMPRPWIFKDFAAFSRALAWIFKDYQHIGIWAYR